jgi:hypothetical protein
MDPSVADGLSLDTPPPPEFANRIAGHDIGIEKQIGCLQLIPADAF